MPLPLRLFGGRPVALARAAARAALCTCRDAQARALAVAARPVSGGNSPAHSSAAIDVWRKVAVVVAQMGTTMMVYGVSCARLVNNQRLRLMLFPCTNPSVQSSALTSHTTNATHTANATHDTHLRDQLYLLPRQRFMLQQRCCHLIKSRSAPDVRGFCIWIAQREGTCASAAAASICHTPPASAAALPCLTPTAFLQTLRPFQS